MADEIHFENRRISNFKGLVTLTLTLDRVIRHTVVRHSSTSTYIAYQISSESEKLFWTDGRTDDRRTDVCTDGRTFEPHIDIIRSTLRSRPTKGKRKATCIIIASTSKQWAEPDSTYTKQRINHEPLFLSSYDT